MKNIHQWLEAYGESHQNPTNKQIHWICVPAILFSIIALLWHFSPGITLLSMGLSLVFYYRLSRPLTIAIGFIYAISLTFVFILTNYLLLIGGLIFAVAWVFQFIGHKIEGKKPSFFEDLQFLLIGPLWCLAYLFRKRNMPY